MVIHTILEAAPKSRRWRSIHIRTPTTLRCQPRLRKIRMIQPGRDKYCIIGAGSSGLAAAKNFLAAGIPFDCLEREDDIGGNWNFGKPASSVYASTQLISSKPLTDYTDF